MSTHQSFSHFIKGFLQKAETLEVLSFFIAVFFGTPFIYVSFIGKLRFFSTITNSNPRGQLCIPFIHDQNRARRNGLKSNLFVMQKLLKERYELQMGKLFLNHEPQIYKKVGRSSARLSSL